MALFPSLIIPRPRVAELEFTGTIVDGTSVSFKAGDHVSGIIDPLDFKGRQGALCQYVAVSPDHLIRRPHSMSAEEGAGITVAGLTARNLLVKNAQVQPGQHIFINGGDFLITYLASFNIH